MKRVTVKDLNGEITHTATMREPSQWIAENISQGSWGKPQEYTIEIEDVTLAYQTEQAIRSRRAEYPSAEEFLDAFFDGGEAGLNELRKRRQAIKAKYPKPQN